MILSWLEALVVTSFVPLLFIYFVFGLDDFFIDFIFWAKKLGPKKLNKEDMDAIRFLPQKRIAIMIAGWKEDDVIEAMIAGNVRQIEYKNYDFFLGVYPNDRPTVEAAQRLTHRFSNVHIVCNSKEGPTSKGQMINELVNGIFQFEKDKNVRFHAFMIHDCEDVIHPFSLHLVNKELDTSDFIQIPIFSLPLKLSDVVGGTYIDEFAESHTKDMLVRNYFQLPIPSAGVGTAMSRRLVNTYYFNNQKTLLNPKSVTEDYELGVSLGQYQLSASFCYYQIPKLNGEWEYVATREYFPKHFIRSIKQKTRWTLGIALQAFVNIGWSSSALQNYFLFRDRKGPWANILVFYGILMLSLFVFFSIIGINISESVKSYYEHLGLSFTLVKLVAIFNLLFMMNRLLQRYLSTSRVYGHELAAISPLRLLVSNVINATASVRAIYQFVKSVITKKETAWSKTQHELPPEFHAILNPTPNAEIIVAREPNFEKQTKITDDLMNIQIESSQNNETRLVNPL